MGQGLRVPELRQAGRARLGASQMQGEGHRPAAAPGVPARHQPARPPASAAADRTPHAPLVLAPGQAGAAAHRRQPHGADDHRRAQLRRRRLLDHAVEELRPRRLRRQGRRAVARGRLDQFRSHLGGGPQRRRLQHRQRARRHRRQGRQGQGQAAGSARLCRHLLHPQVRHRRQPGAAERRQHGHRRLRDHEGRRRRRRQLRQVAGLRRAAGCGRQVLRAAFRVSAGRRLRRRQAHFHPPHPPASVGAGDPVGQEGRPAPGALRS